MIADLALRYWQIIVGGLVALALSVALFATRATLAERTAKLETAQTRLSVSNASISRLEAEISRIMEEQRQLATSDEARIQASRESLAVVDAASKVREAARERLLASANVLRPAKECQVSVAVAEIWP